MPRFFIFTLILLLYSPHCIIYAKNSAAKPQSALSVTEQAIQASVTEFLEQQASGYPGTIQVSVDELRKPPPSPCSLVQTSLSGSQRLRSRMSLTIKCLENNSWTLRITASLAINGYFYVPNRTIETGETLSLDDLIGREGDILALARGVVIDPSQLIDQIATQRIPRGTPIKASSLRSPLSVTRGQTVRTRASGPGFVVTSEAQTLQEGSPGEQIRVKTASGQVISAIVIDAHTVEVPM